MDTLNQGISVLLVDDDRTFVAAAARALVSAGCRVRTVTSYFDALDLLDKPEIAVDVLVTDVVLDKGNGFALARIARFHRKHLKAVYVTGSNVSLEEAIGPVLRKPVSLDDVVIAVREAVGLRQANCA
ncbi:MAG TPA: response regulator [Alphaproteobacteria bacterium]|jgi:DNA-binding NtrC family response regulator|nr:response regulator [Alphaproteobacteria bacterium]